MLKMPGAERTDSASCSASKQQPRLHEVQQPPRQNEAHGPSITRTIQFQPRFISQLIDDPNSGNSAGAPLFHLPAPSMGRGRAWNAIKQDSAPSAQQEYHHRGPRHPQIKLQNAIILRWAGAIQLCAFGWPQISPSFLWRRHPKPQPARRHVFLDGGQPFFDGGQLPLKRRNPPGQFAIRWRLRLRRRIGFGRNRRLRFRAGFRLRGGRRGWRLRFRSGFRGWRLRRIASAIRFAREASRRLAGRRRGRSGLATQVQVFQRRQLVEDGMFVGQPVQPVVVQVQPFQRRQLVERRRKAGLPAGCRSSTAVAAPSACRRRRRAGFPADCCSSTAIPAPSDRRSRPASAWQGCGWRDSSFLCPPSCRPARRRSRRRSDPAPPESRPQLAPSGRKCRWWPGFRRPLAS